MKGIPGGRVASSPEELSGQINPGLLIVYLELDRFHRTNVRKYRESGQLFPLARFIVEQP
jgi:hypothetical protein